MPLWFQRRRPRRPDDELVLCAHCGCDFVSPVDWAEHDETSWWIRLRCGQCGSAREVVVSQEAADRYDRALDRASEAIASKLSRMEHERMAADVSAFVTALRLDLIDAADFGGRWSWR
jgi:transcription elongation factor Elf1